VCSDVVLNFIEKISSAPSVSFVKPKSFVDEFSSHVDFHMVAEMYMSGTIAVRFVVQTEGYL